MCSYRLVLAILFAVYANGDILEVCNFQDLECMKRTTEKFLEKTHAGIPQYDVKVLDPLTISEVVYHVGDDNGVFTFRNLTVTEMKNQKMQHFNLNTDKKLVKLSTKATLQVVGSCEVSFTKFDKKFTGPITAKFTEIGTTEYNYDIVKDDKGVEHYKAGPETVSVEILDDLQYTFDSETTHQLENDPVVKETWEQYNLKRDEIVKGGLTLIVKQAYAVALHNIRAMANILPKTAFFNNL